MVTSIASLFCNRIGEVSATQEEASVIHDICNIIPHLLLVIVLSAKHIVWCVLKKQLQKNSTEEK